MVDSPSLTLPFLSVCISDSLPLSMSVSLSLTLSLSVFQ